MNNSLHPVKRFFRLLNVDRKDIISIYVYALFNGLVNLSLPLGIQAIIGLITGGQTSTSWIVLVSLVIAALIFAGVLQVLQLTIIENVQQKIFTRSAFEFAYRIPRLKVEAVDSSYVPELVNRFFDTLSVQKGLSKILKDFSIASLQIVVGLLLLSVYHPFFIIFSIVLVGIVYLIFRFTAAKGLRSSLKESKYKYEVVHWLEELGRAMETFKLAGKTPLPLQKTNEGVEKYLDARNTHFRTLIIQYINLIGFKVFIAAGLLIIGGLLVINQQMNIGQFVASEIIIILVLNSVEKLILSMETIYDVLTSIEKIGSVTDIPIESATGEKMQDHTEGMQVKLKELSYAFPNAKQNILNEINLEIDSGERICLSGYNASGKSVLLQTIAGLYEKYEGSISYDSMPLDNWCKEELRSLIGDSLSKEDIVHATLLENVTLNKPNVTMDKVREITKVLGLEDFIQSLPEGYNTMLTSEGSNLPKSARLKIMLARSVIADPKLILLEDNFNQLIEEDKQSFLNYILDRSKTWTVIAVTDDWKIAKQFDRVLIMRKGEIIVDSPAGELLKGDWYEELFRKY